MLIKRILYFITGANDIEKNSSGGNIDARDLHVIEQFMGCEFNGVGGTSPNVNAAKVFEEVYSQIEAMYFNLLNKEGYNGEYLDLITLRWGENVVYLDTAFFEEKIYSMISNGEDVSDILSGISSWIYQYEISHKTSHAFNNLKTTFSDYAELFDHVIDTNVILGTKSSDNIVGTNKNGIIYVDADNDTIFGGKGNDILIGDEGNGAFDGGTYIFTKVYGNDVVIDSEGLNTLKFKGLKSGDISINGTGDNDVTVTIKGTNDTLILKDFRKGDSLSADAHGNRNYNLEFDDAKMFVTDKNSPFRHIYGGCGNDTLKAAVEDSVMHAFCDDDTVYVSKGNDVIYGDEGNDTIYAGNGNDYVYGGENNDTIDGGEGNDFLYGGSGDDTYIFGKNYGTDIINDTEGVSTIRLAYGISLADLKINAVGENAVIGINDTADKLIISNFAANPENYVLQIGDEKVLIKDNISAEENEFVSGSENYDYIVKENKTVIAGEASGDRIIGSDNDEYTFGDSGDDQLLAGAGNDAVFGGNGDDVLTIRNFDSERFTFEFADGVNGTVNTSGEFLETVSEETIIQNNADVLNDIYSDDGLTTDSLDGYVGTVIPEMADTSAVSENDENLSAQSDIQVMILSENMAGFADENKVSEGVNFSDTNENVNSMNQLMVNTQAQ